MKKILVTVLMAAMSMSMLTACGQSNDAKDATASAVQTAEQTQPDEAAEVSETSDKTTEAGGFKMPAIAESKASDFVTLGEYKGVASDYKEHDVVESGDTVNIDYVGKLNGVAFDGGTANGYDLTIGSGTFIPGFEDGLIGAKVGETVDIDLTFPEEYHAPELAGQAVVFTVTVNSIDAGTAQAKADILDKVIENSTFKEIPDWLIQEKIDYMQESAKQYAESMGVSYEDFLSQALSQTEEEFMADCKEYAQKDAKQLLVVYAIAQAEGLEISEAEAESMLSSYATSYGMSSYEDFANSVQGATFLEYLQMDKVIDFLFENRAK